MMTFGWRSTWCLFAWGGIVALTVILCPVQGLAVAEEPASRIAQALSAYEAQGDWFELLRQCELILEEEPGHREALRGRIVAADALGAPFLAAEMALKTPEVLTDEDWHRLRGHQGALAVRWGRLPSREPGERFVGTDQALALLDGNLRLLEGRAAAEERFAHQAAFDRMAALRDRGRMEEVIAEYERLTEEGAVLPYYALAAAGDAFLTLREPERSRDLYLQALQTDPDPFDVRMSLFYAYIALEDFSRALPLIDALAAEIPPWRRGAGPDPTPVPEKVTAEVGAALGRVFGEQPAGAQLRLEPLLARAPYNRDLYREMGTVYSARGWPRRAAELYRAWLALEPRHRGLRVGLAQSALDLHEYAEAAPMVGSLVALYPENAEVRTLARRWENSLLRELRIEGNGGRSTGAELGSRDLTLGATLYSSPFQSHYRGFVSAMAARADFPEGDEISRRYGLGIEYRRADWDASAELTYNVDGGDEIGGRVAATWRGGDRWSVPAALERFSSRTPLRALRHGIRADAADLAVVYRHSESRRAELRGGIMDFTDGNFRRSLLASAMQRIVSRPRVRLEAALELYASANSKTEAPYFNPERDVSVIAALDAVHRVYRRYERAFSHRLVVSAGEYRQKNFGGDTTASLLYEHIWTLGDRLDLVYGVSRHRRSYDGEREYHNRLHTALSWRF